MISPISKNKVEYDIKTYSYRYHQKDKNDKKTKISVAAGAAIGTLLPLALFAKKQKVNPFKLHYGLKELLIVSTAGIAGGTIAGMAVGKKEHRKQKLNEGVFQFMNSSVPAVLTAAILALSSKVKALNNNSFKIAGTLLGVFAGMQVAAFLSNKINDPQDKVPDRKLTLKDSVANVDDVFGALVLAKIPIAQKLHVEKILPAIFAWCGYRAGNSN